MKRASQRISGILALLIISCGPATSPRESTVDIVATHTGSESCVSCHADQAKAWRGSHHDLAMQPATAETVLGDFDGASFDYFGNVTTFSRQGDGFFVRTAGGDGIVSEHRVAYTFGVEPLQQYLIEFPDGRVQALSICWDTRPADQGGQRWFHLEPEEEILPEDPLHWTGPMQNWNAMCAECHSTNLRRGYNAATNTYDTTWSEIDVGCEACHGPGSQHIAWATSGAEGDSRLSGPGPSSARQWIFAAGADVARRDSPQPLRAEVEACGRCHSRRAPLAEDTPLTAPLAEGYEVSLLQEGLYHADGQILEEVFVYGSFVQSKMYQSGVTCSDCHDPHGANLRREVDAVCGSCHRMTTYASEQHHHHPPSSEGARCVSCHMPTKNYMVVDARHDHGFRVPRPDLAVRLGTPEPCTSCHSEHDAQWAATTVEAWRGGTAPEFHWGEALHAGRAWQDIGGELLLRALRDTETPPIARASALALLVRYPSPAALESIETSLNDHDPLVRRAALTALESAPSATRYRLALPYLDDSVGSVRAEAARVLLTVAPADWPSADLANRALAREMYRGVQEASLDQAESQIHLGWLYSLEQDSEAAERAYRQALALRPTHAAAAINLADLFRSAGQDAEGELVLREALERLPENGALHHTLGLLMVRTGRLPEAITAFARSVELEPGEPYYAYVYGIALEGGGEQEQARKVQESVAQRFPAFSG